MLCSASEIALLAEADFKRGLVVSSEQALPVYLRNQVAQKSST
jgi:tRNA A37 threonylcarbamoyladenosine modification protein TsaB